MAGSSTIADEALKDLGTWGGQCFTWVKKVVDRATPYSMGWGYRDGYLGAGAVEVPLLEAVRGDIIQLANDAYLGAGATYAGLHTSIVLDNLGGGRFDVIDSNQNWDEIVRLRPGYEPLDAAARYVGISVHVYRFPGGSATDAAPPATQLEPGTPAVIDAGGDCLRLRSAPGLDGVRLDCLPDGSIVSVTGDPVTADGLVWLPVDTVAGSGWMAAIYLTDAPPGTTLPGTDTTSTDTTATEAPAAADTSDDPGTTNVTNTDTSAIEGDGYTLAIPPQGGLTRGPAGTDDPAALVEAQAFPVKSVSVLEISTQTWLTYVPGAPAFVNTLEAGDLDPDAIVAVKRTTSGAATGEAPSELPVTGVEALPQPPVGGITQGIAGTSDVSTLLSAQPFKVETLLAWDVASQGFLTYIPGAPAHVQTLNASNLAPDMVVVMRRAAGSPASTTPASTGPATDQRLASITYYYCQQGSIPAGIGDGGGWCGVMASGQTVYEGAAACAPQYLGQRFRIVDDPIDRTYTCADTGGGVAGEHRDIFFYNSDDGYNWWLQVGSTATIEIVG